MRALILIHFISTATITMGERERDDTMETQWRQFWGGGEGGQVVDGSKIHDLTLEKEKMPRNFMLCKTNDNCLQLNLI